MGTVHNTLNKLFKTSNHNDATSGSCFTCEICIETVPLSEKFKNMEASGCFHPYCTNCVAKYIEIKVIHDNMSNIKCPNTNCSVFEKWCRVLCEAAVLLDASKGGFVYGRCFCPNRKCSELILNQLFCFTCMVPWKENHQCRRQTGDIAIDIDMDRNDLLFMEMAKRNGWIRCPNCNVCIELLPADAEICSSIITCRFFPSLNIFIPMKNI
ncbi:hypothetical protein MKW98_016671 [Papaver atlanticum]|uniref:Uncharacterized protein n=1 Tax=Papaver atlanticum TaxID=357466 RepID=A0AAD4SSQ5_9MAGN|nr:hypothetical protein MKW98_016671 [Papaver atlanticum]